MGERGSDGALADPADIGDLAVREVGEVVQEDEQAPAWAQLLERVRQFRVMIAGRGRRFGCELIEVHLFATVAARLERRVHGNPPYPCRQRALTPILLAVTERTCESLLHDVAGRLVVARQPDHALSERRVPRFVQLLDLTGQRIHTRPDRGPGRPISLSRQAQAQHRLQDYDPSAAHARPFASKRRLVTVRCARVLSPAHLPDPSASHLYPGARARARIPDPA